MTQPMTIEQREMCIAMREAGASHARIARELGVAKSTVGRCLSPQIAERDRLRSERRRTNPVTKIRNLEAQKRYVKSPLGKLAASRSAARKRGYIPCLATIEELQMAHAGKCDLCGKPEKEGKRRLHMDHNHHTGEFRGWLCQRCNHMIGLANDSPAVLELAADWLRNRGCCTVVA